MPLLGGGALGWHQPDLARDAQAVGERFVGLDQPVADRQDVHAFEFQRRCRSPRRRSTTPDPAKVPVISTAPRSARPRWSSRPPPSSCPASRSISAADELAHALGREHVHLAAHVLAPARRPHRHRARPRRGRRSPRSSGGPRLGVAAGGSALVGGRAVDVGRRLLHLACGRLAFSVSISAISPPSSRREYESTRVVSRR